MQTYHTTRRMVLRSSDGERLVRRLIDELNMQLVGETQRLAGPALDRESTLERRLSGLTRTAAWQVVPGVQMLYLEDGWTLCKAVMLVGEAEAKTIKFAELIERLLQPLSLEEFLTAIDEATDQPGRVQAVLRAGLGAPHEFDERFFDRMVEATGSDSLAMRVAGVHATTYSCWPEFQKPWALVAAIEEDPGLREELGFLLELSLSHVDGASDEL